MREARAVVEKILEQTIYNVLYGDEERERMFRDHFMDAYERHIAAALDQARQAGIEEERARWMRKFPSAIPPGEGERVQAQSGGRGNNG